MQWYSTFTYILFQFSRVQFNYIIRWKNVLSFLIDWVFQMKLCVFIPDISMIPTSLQYLDWKNSKVFPSLHYIICIYFVKQNNMTYLKPIICVLGRKIPLTFALTCKFLNILCCCNPMVATCYQFNSQSEDILRNYLDQTMALVGK